MQDLDSNSEPELTGWELGNGPPLVMLHGWSCSSSVWRELAERLSSISRCLAIDLRGHGATPPASRPYTLRDHAIDVVRWMGRRGLQKPVLLGWSMGAQIALEAASLGTELTGLILVAGTARFSSTSDYPHGLPPQAVDGLATRLRLNHSKALRRFFESMFTKNELPEGERLQWIQTLVAQAPDCGSALSALSALASGDARQHLASIHLPTLLVHGDADPIIPPSASTFLADALPTARMELLPGTGHAPLFSRVEPLLSLVIRFLGEVQPASRNLQRDVA